MLPDHRGRLGADIRLIFLSLGNADIRAPGFFSAQRVVPADLDLVVPLLPVRKHVRRVKVQFPVFRQVQRHRRHYGVPGCHCPYGLKSIRIHAPEHAAHIRIEDIFVIGSQGAFHRHLRSTLLSFGFGSHCRLRQADLHRAGFPVKLGVQCFQINHAVAPGRDHRVARPVVQCGGLKTSVVVQCPAVLAVRSVNQLQFLCVVQVVCPQADPSGLDLHLSGKLAHAHIGLAHGMQTRRAVHRITQLDAVAGNGAVVQVQETDRPVLSGNDHFLQLFLGLF